MSISSNEKISKIKIQNCLFKTIGFMNCDKSFYDGLIENNFVKKNDSQQRKSTRFLNLF